MSTGVVILCKKKAGYKGKVTGSITFVWVYEPSEEVKKSEEPIRAKLHSDAQTPTMKHAEHPEKMASSSSSTPAPSQDNPATSTSIPPAHVTITLSGKAESLELEKLRHSALLGNARDAFELGKCYAYGSKEYKIEEDDKEALKYYLIAAEADHAVSQFKVGLFFQMGYGCDANFSRAFLWYEKAVAQNQPDALAAIAELYESGWGVDQDVGKALDYYERAVEFGEKDALSALGRLYKQRSQENSSLLPKALEFLQKAVAHHAEDFESLFLLGEMYENGLGVEKDTQKAIQYYKQASVDDDHYESREALKRLGVELDD